MTPDKEEALKAHLKAIARILYDESDPQAMKTLEEIELTVRQQIQTHVSPELGFFYPNCHRNASREATNAEKYFGGARDHDSTSTEVSGSTVPSTESSSRELLSTLKRECIL